MEKNLSIPTISKWERQNGVMKHDFDVSQERIIREFIKNNPNYYYKKDIDTITVYREEK